MGYHFYIVLFFQSNPADGVERIAGQRGQEEFLEKVRQSNAAIQAGQFDKAAELYTQALALDPNNYILYSNRAAAYMKLNEADLALKDARTAKLLNPTWPKVCHYYYNVPKPKPFFPLHCESAAQNTYCPGIKIYTCIFLKLRDTQKIFSQTSHKSDFLYKTSALYNLRNLDLVYPPQPSYQLHRSENLHE